jgi:endonuclease I
MFQLQNSSLKKLSFFLALFFSLEHVCAQIPTGYYNAAQGLQGLPLKLALHQIIKNHNSVTYASLWNHFQATDAKPNGEVWDIYSDVPNGTPPYTFTFVSNQCGTYSVEGDCYNREHSWPQSWFNSLSVPSSDMFHIYPTDGKVNGIRSNYPYGEVATASITTLNGSMLGSSATAGYNGTVFEPIDEYKGDLARGYFYMCVRYYLEDSAWSNASNQMCNKSEIEPWGLQQLLAWHHQDTVSLKEINRNNAIYQIQNNRNPFIDNPQWADSIWIPILTNLSHQQVNEDAASNLIFLQASKELQVSISASKANTISSLSIYNLIGSTVLQKNISCSSLVDLTPLPQGIYVATFQFDGKLIQRKILIE